MKQQVREQTFPFSTVVVRRAIDLRRYSQFACCYYGGDVVAVVVFIVP